MHCYSYSPEMAVEYLKMGFYLGIGGVLTFKNAKKLKEVVEIAPIERLLLETDCPYLAPVPNRGKRNDSTNIHYVAEELARLKGNDPGRSDPDHRKRMPEDFTEFRRRTYEQTGTKTWKS